MLRKALISSLCVMFALSGITVAHAEETTNEPVEVTEVKEETVPTEEETVTPVPLTEEPADTTVTPVPEADQEAPAEPIEITATGTQKAFVIGDDWGAAVSKTIIALDKEVTSDSVSKDKFVVKETKATPDFTNYPTITLDTVTVERTILNAYVSDENGNPLMSWWGPSTSKYITIEMYVSPTEGSAFAYTGLNIWCDPYELAVSLVDGATLTTTTSETIATLDVEEVIDLAGDGKICPQIDGVQFYGVYGEKDSSYYYEAKDGTVVQVPYAYYEPQYDGHKNPIVIWNHGAGEGGTDPQIDVLANEVTALFGAEFQGIMDGAYVITPQVPKNAPRDPNRALAIQQLVLDLAKENPDIDLDRVYVGGCSAGGMMTLISLFTTPDFYTAAFPICAAYRGEVTDEMAASLKDVPMWFIHSLNDDTVKYEGGTKLIVDKLIEAGVEVHQSLFKDVHDTTGRFTDENGDPYQYAGHWSWIYFDNNECFDENGENCWEWLASQTKNACEYTGTQKVFIVGEEWGAGVTKTIMTLNTEIDAASVSVEDFSVVENKDGQITNRTVLNAYVSDENGNKVTTNSKYVTVELGISPTEGNPITWSMTTWRNTWPNSYKLYVNINDGQSITSGETTITEIGVVPTIDVDGKDMICPQLDGVVEDSYTYTPENGKDVVIPYGYYEPKADDHKNAIVIWNHGIGEGGTDPKIAMLGNEVTSLFSDEFQEAMNGAYVLVAQVPNDGDRDVNRAEAIIQLVKDLAAENPDIDLDKVIIGGCSAGGGMTMTTILAHPEFFAAAFPICAAGNYTDEQLEAIVDLPVWFIHAENDDTVNYNNSTKSFVERLVAMGATDVHTSIFEDVHDTSHRFDDEDGNPYQYSGHWSWVYFFNNECFDENGQNCWEWVSTQKQKSVATGDQKAYVIGDDWGPAVSKTIVTLEKTIDASSIAKEDFEVIETKLMTNFGQNPEVGFGEAYVGSAPRTILDAYASDASGNKVTGDSKYITIEMYVSPNEGSPFIYSLATGFNSWCDPYELHVQLAPHATLTSGDEIIGSLDVEADIDVAGNGKICPQGDVFNTSTYKASDGITYSYAEFIPEKDNYKNALVVWLHGAGEGGNDPQIDYLGNEVTAFTGQEFQKLFGGAYVLCPQAPTMWMDDGTGNYQSGSTGSCYAEGLFDLIDNYVKTHPDIDPEKVIIGGCSNGGYMTMEMILKHPDYFAAAFPICEAYEDQYITDDQIEAIKDMPIWFTYAKTDPVVDFTATTEATVARLRAAGAKNIYVTALDKVVDTTGRFVDENGNPYEYNGHWSWIYFDNNECYDGDVNAWEYLGHIASVNPVLTGDNTMIVPFVAMAGISFALMTALVYKKKKNVTE